MQDAWRKLLIPDTGYAFSEPPNGITNIRSQVLLAVWDSFKEHGIEIPFPQRDLHIRASGVDFVSRGNPNPE